MACRSGACRSGCWTAVTGAGLRKQASACGHHWEEQCPSIWPGLAYSARPEPRGWQVAVQVEDHASIVVGALPQHPHNVVVEHVHNLAHSPTIALVHLCNVVARADLRPTHTEPCPHIVTAWVRGNWPTVRQGRPRHMPYLSRCRPVGDTPAGLCERAVWCASLQRFQERHSVYQPKPQVTQCDGGAGGRNESCGAQAHACGRGEGTSQWAQWAPE